MTQIRGWLQNAVHSCGSSVSPSLKLDATVDKSGEIFFRVAYDNREDRGKKKNGRVEVMDRCWHFIQFQGRRAYVDVGGQNRPSKALVRIPSKLRLK